MSVILARLRRYGAPSTTPPPTPDLPTAMAVYVEDADSDPAPEVTIEDD